MLKLDRKEFKRMKTEQLHATDPSVSFSKKPGPAQVGAISKAQK